MGRIEKVKQIGRLADEGIKNRVKRVRDDKRHVVLVVIELVLVFGLVVSLVFLFDPSLSFPQAQDIPWYLKFFLFLIGVFLVFKVYSYTRDFRFEKSKEEVVSQK